MRILINSSKTMAMSLIKPHQARPARFVTEAAQLDTNLKKYSAKQLARMMHLSPDLAVKTQALIAGWTEAPQVLALDSFAGDIYRGLRADDFTQGERQYADKYLLVLSGLYGAIRPLDGISPYRLEVGYPVKGRGFANLYQFWGNKVAGLLEDGPIINLASVEYAKLVTPFINPARIISPQFLSVKKGSNDFIVVHAKVARGAFARWLVKQKVTDLGQLPEFNDLDYVYRPELSTALQPTYVRPFN